MDYSSIDPNENPDEISSNQNVEDVLPAPPPGLFGRTFVRSTSQNDNVNAVYPTTSVSQGSGRGRGRGTVGRGAGTSMAVNRTPAQQQIMHQQQHQHQIQHQYQQQLQPQHQQQYHQQPATGTGTAQEGGQNATSDSRRHLIFSTETLRSWVKCATDMLKNHPKYDFLKQFTRERLIKYNQEDQRKLLMKSLIRTYGQQNFRAVFEKTKQRAITMYKTFDAAVKHYGTPEEVAGIQRRLAPYRGRPMQPPDRFQLFMKAIQSTNPDLYRKCRDKIMAAITRRGNQTSGRSQVQITNSQATEQAHPRPGGIPYSTHPQLTMVTARANEVQDGGVGVQRGRGRGRGSTGTTRGRGRGRGGRGGKGKVGQPPPISSPAATGRGGRGGRGGNKNTTATKRKRTASDSRENSKAKKQKAKEAAQKKKEKEKQEKQRKQKDAEEAARKLKEREKELREEARKRALEEKKKALKLAEAKRKKAKAEKMAKRKREHALLRAKRPITYELDFFGGIIAKRREWDPSTMGNMPDENIIKRHKPKPGCSLQQNKWSSVLPTEVLIGLMEDTTHRCHFDQNGISAPTKPTINLAGSLKGRTNTNSAKQFHGFNNTTSQVSEKPKSVPMPQTTYINTNTTSLPQNRLLDITSKPAQPQSQSRAGIESNEKLMSTSTSANVTVSQKYIQKPDNIQSSTKSPTSENTDSNVTVHDGSNSVTVHQNGNGSSTKNTPGHCSNETGTEIGRRFGLPEQDEEITELAKGMAEYLNNMLKETLLSLVKFSKHRQSCAENKNIYADTEAKDKDSILPRLDGEARRNAVRSKLYQVNKDMKILQAAEKGGLKRGSKNKAARLLKREKDNPGWLKAEKEKVISSFLNRTKVFYDKPEPESSGSVYTSATPRATSFAIENGNGQMKPLQVEREDLITYLKTNNDPSRRLWLSLLNEPDN